MPLGNIFMVVFFILTFIASIGAQLSLLEVITAFLENHFKITRAKATLFTILPLALVGSLAALSSSLLANVKVAGLNFFDLFDFGSSNILLPLGGLFLAIFTGWFLGKQKFFANLTNNGSLKNQKFVGLIFNILRFITPPLVLIILLSGLKIIKIN